MRWIVGSVAVRFPPISDIASICGFDEKGLMRTTAGTCNRKRRYASQADALTAAATAAIKLAPYRCALCRDYHLTRRTKGMFVSRRPFPDQM